MPGPAQPWDPPEDPRDQTVDLPRIDLASFGNGRPQPPGPQTLEPPTRYQPSAQHEPLASEAPRLRQDSPARPESPPSAIPDSSRDPYALPEPDFRPGPLFSRRPGAEAAPVEQPLSGPPPASPQPTPAMPSPPAMPTPPRIPAPHALPAAHAMPAGPAPSLMADMPELSELPLSPATPPGSQSAAAARRRPERAPQGRPTAGSVRDLLARLDRLPDGHPSSPYEDGGLAKPLPHRLRQLELGLPAPERELGDNVLRPGPAGAHVAAQPPAIEYEPEAAQLTAGEQIAGELADIEMADIEMAADASPAGPPGVAPSAQGPVRGGNGAHSARTGSWQDPYAARAGANGHADPVRSAPEYGELALRPWSAEAPATTPRPAASALPANGDAGTSRPEPDTAITAQVQTSRLTGEQGRLVAGLLAACQAAEGRNLFGDYGESGLTPAIRRIADQLPQGGLAPGSETDTLKSAERLAAKLARLITRHPGRSAAELAAGIGDGVRYVFTFDPDYYAEGTWLVHRKLKAQGFELEARRNRWDSPEYKGVWTRWRDPAHSLPFEIQFHTGASWDVIRGTHRAYVQITDPQTPAPERARLRARQVAAAAAAKAPPRCAEISDFGREAR